LFNAKFIIAHKTSILKECSGALSSFHWFEQDDI